MTSDTSDYTGREVVDRVGGIDLYTSDDEKVGHIAEVGTDYIVVESGDVFDRAMYLPRTAISESDDDRWYVQGDVWQFATESWTGDGAVSSGAMNSAAADTSYGQTDKSYDQQTAARTATDTDADSQRIQLHEEELQAQKTAREAGQVVLTKEVVEETRTIEVPVTREEVRIERRPVSGEATGEDANAFTGDTIRVPVMEEQVEVRKVPRAVEEIEISKTRTQDTERVEDTVRKEHLNVDDSSERLREESRTS